MSSLVQFPQRPNPLDDEPESLGAKMSFLEHLDELRRRLIISIASIAAGFCVALSFVDRISRFVMQPLTAVVPDHKLIYTQATEPFLLYLKIAALAGIVLASPVVLAQVWLFVAPGLYSNEKKFAVPFVVLSTVCFVAGVLFGHLVVFPSMWRFFASFSNDYLTFLPTIQNVFSLYSKMLLGMGLVFELPTLVFFLARFGLVSARFLWRNTKYAILIIFIIAAVLTPSPDAITQCIFAAPMLLLYGISILIAWLFGKKRTVTE